MISINKNLLSSISDLQWMAEKLDDSFNIDIDDGHSKIIFGFNGIGKTTFSRSLRLQYPDKLKFLDYEECITKENSNELVISPFISTISETEKKIEEKEKEIDFAAMTKKTGFTKAAGGKGSDLIKSYCKTLKTGAFASKVKTTSDEYEKFIKKYPNVNVKTYVLISSELEAITNSSEEIEKYNKTKYAEFLKSSKNYIDSNNGLCPVCDTEKEDLLSIIENKENKLKQDKSALIEKLEENSIPFDSKIIDQYIKLNKELKENGDLLNDFIVCGQSVEIHKNISAVSASITENAIKLTTLQKDRDDKYNEISKNKDLFKQDISKYLNVDESNIDFDDTGKKIVIKLERNVETYSTGERHILWFLNEIYSFIGSDQKILVLDDPASSLDIINLYKIAFEIVRTNASSDKTIIVFTHSVELINAINSQRPDFIKMYYLEEYQGKIYCDQILYEGKNIPNVITSERFDGFNPDIYNSLKKRDYEGHSCPEHGVYHYSLSEQVSTVDSNLSNYKLIDLIDSYSGLTKTDFYKNSFNKALLLIALRVWIEKALFLLIPAGDQQRQDDFFDKDQLQQKISVIENSSYGSDLFQINNIKKENITSRKVMLNQNAHFYSQIMPFAYAINLSLDDLDKEIREIKALFI